MEALFTKVPLEALLDFFERKIHANTFSTPIHLAEFCAGIEVCTKNIYFPWDNSIYQLIFRVRYG